MCFSAAASFTASGALAVIGVLTLRQVNARQEKLLASVPLLFSAQQLIEGVLWLVLLQGAAAQHWITQSYAFFVGVVWPLVIPASIYLIERDPARKRFVSGCLLVGIGIAIYTLKIIFGAGVSAVIVKQCIQYEGVTAAGTPLLIAYVAATIAAFFCSSHRSINIIGLMNMLAFAAAYYSYEINFASGWCFLAAVMSGFIYLHFRHTARLPAAAPIFK